MRIIEKTLEYITIFLLVLLTIVITLQIFSRTFHFSLYWSEELSIYLFLGLVFLGGAFAYLKGENFRITTFVDKFPPKVKRITDIIILLITVGIMFVIIATSIIYIIEIWGSSTLSLGWNKALIVTIVPVGYAIICLKVLKDIKRVFQKKESDLEGGIK